MDAINSILTIISDCYMEKVDVKDAYYSIPIFPEHQRCLKFLFRGSRNQFTYLPNNRSLDPRDFTMLLKPSLSLWRKLLVAIAAYIDD